MAFATPSGTGLVLQSRANSPSKHACRRRARVSASATNPARAAALDAPVKEDVRTRLNKLLTTPTVTPATDPSRVRQNVDPGRQYKVLIFNDEANSKEYVTRVLLRVIPGLSEEQAYAIMNKAHTNGMAVVGIWIFEVSEGYCEMLRNNGLRSDIEQV